MNKKSLAIASLIGVAIGYGTLSIAARLMGEVFGLYTQVYVRIFLAMLTMLTIYWRDIRWYKIFKLSLRDWFVLVLMGTVGYGLMVFAITKGALTTSLLNVSVLFSTVPIFVYLLGVLFLSRPWRLSIIGLLLFSIYGVGVLSSGSFITSVTRLGVGDLWVVLSAFFEAIWYLGIRLMEYKLNSREMTFIAQAIAALTIFVLASYTGESLPTLRDFSSLKILAGLAVGIAMNVAAPLITIFAFKHLDEVFATQLFLSENIFSLIVGYLAYGEIVSLTALSGAGIVIASVYTMNRLQSS